MQDLNVKSPSELSHPQNKTILKRNSNYTEIKSKSPQLVLNEAVNKPVVRGLSDGKYSDEEDEEDE